MLRTRQTTGLLYALFFFSGSAGLGYQMVWAKMFAAGLGHEMPAVLAVVCAFMGGMALGAWTLDRKVSRSSRPDRWYGGLEILIGLWGLLSATLIPAANQCAVRLIGLEPSPLRQWTVAFILPFLALVPATAAMGATLPAMERFVSRMVLNRGCVGGLYATNTLGAVAGTLSSAFLIIPTLGLSRTVWLLAVINLVCGAAAWFVGARVVSPAATPYDQTQRDGIQFNSVVSVAASKRLRAPEVTRLSSGLRLSLTLLFTGMLGIGYEVVGTRVLAQVLENTVFTFAAVLSVYLLGTSMGAALYQRVRRRRVSPFLLTDLLGGMSLACALGVLALAKAQLLYDTCRAMLGDSPLAVLAAEMAVAAAVFALPTLFMGATFSHLVQSARREDGGVGQAAALNTIGGALSGAVFGVGLLPPLGSKWTLVLIALGYLLLLPAVARWRWVWLVAASATVFILPANLHLIDMPPGGRVLEYREGVMASVAVLEDATGHRTLRVDNRFQMGGTAAATAEYRHAQIPLLLHPAPRRGLVLGMGTGITLGAASLHPNLLSDGVELVPEVAQVMPRFEPYNFSPAHHPQIKTYVADARRFVRATTVKYDVIVADLFHPARDGAGALYTQEHFQAIRQRLAPGGLFCQWLPLHQLDETMLRVIVRTFREVFPEAQAWLLHFNVDAPVVGLIGSLTEIRYSPQWVERRLSDPTLLAQLKKLALADSIRFFGNVLAGPNELRKFAGNAPLNTDDQPRITFGAPRFAYQKEVPSWGRLLVLLKLGPVHPRESLRFSADAESTEFARRLADYVRARDVYLTGLVEDTEGRRPQAIDAYVQSARLSEDFTLGYAQCLGLASLLAKDEPTEARLLLERLVAAQPGRPVAKEMLDRLDAREGGQKPQPRK